MADEVPFDVVGQSRNLSGKFLRTILPETVLPGIICGQYVTGRVEFGNCHQFDPWRQFL